jgi:hypothetical protein
MSYNLPIFLESLLPPSSWQNSTAISFGQELEAAGHGLPISLQQSLVSSLWMPGKLYYLLDEHVLAKQKRTVSVNYYISH